MGHGRCDQREETNASWTETRLPQLDLAKKTNKDAPRFKLSTPVGDASSEEFSRVFSVSAKAVRIQGPSAPHTEE